MTFEVITTAVSYADTIALGLTVTLAALAFPFVLAASRLADTATDAVATAGEVSGLDP